MSFVWDLGIKHDLCIFARIKGLLSNPSDDYVYKPLFISLLSFVFFLARFLFLIGIGVMARDFSRFYINLYTYECP